MNKLLGVFILIATLCNAADAQFVKNENYLGPSLGFYFHGSTPIFGANFEHAMDTDLGDGILGIGGIFRYWSWSTDEGYWGDESWGWTYTDIMIGVQGNYHFKVGDEKIDPWAGLTLAYDAASVKYKGPAGFNYSSPTSGGLFLGANAGARYWFSKSMSVVARIGLGTLSYSALDIGIDFRL